MEPFVLKDDAKQLVTGAVAVPGCPDCDYSRGEKILSIDEIEGMVHWFNTFSRKSDVMHTYNSNGTTVGDTVENWTLKQPMTVKNILGKTRTYPKGTWMSTTKITDDKTWNQVQDGTLRGYSATYMSKDAAKEFVANKRTLIADLDDPVPVLVSIVDNPCVEDAIFCSIKQDAPPEPDPEISEVLYKSEKAGRKISNATLKKITDAFETMKTLINDALTERGETGADKNVLEDIDMDEEQLTKLVREAVKAELELQRQEPEPGAEEEVEEETVEESEPEPSEAEKQLAEAQAEIEALKQKLGEGESQKIEGQDEEKPEAQKDRALKFEFEDRDAFGCKIHKE